MMIKRKKDTASYRITIHREADGGPEHLLWLLREYVVEFRKNGKTIATGMIMENNVGNGSRDSEYIQCVAFNEATGLHDGETVRLHVYTDFDEVVYL